MAEHGARYQTLATFLNNYGISVYAIDHRGHGKSVKSEDEIGHFTRNPLDDSWEKVIGDLEKTVKYLKTLYQNTPIFLLGHSMGSFISLGYAIRYGSSLNGLILSGSNFSPAFFYQSARIIAALESLRQGIEGKSDLISFLSFGSFNKKFEPARTEFDWLSRDPNQVDLYINDPHCGFKLSNKSWKDLLGGLIEISKQENLARIPSNLPVYLFAGEHDPVGGFGKGVKQLATELSTCGITNLKLKLYSEGRHEMINEINKSEVFQDIIDWIKTIV
ncbi:MAG: lysophospholipase [Acidobacteria bacterium]|nr:lysophospholipase [Acidobacteriota bacterium]